jgi:adenine-specific DNA-methyltransferase
MATVVNGRDMSTAETNSTSTVVADEPEKLDLRSFDISDEKRAELLALFPEARTEGGKIDFDRLKLALCEAMDVGKERYGMNWPGKADCFRTIQTPSVGTLRPAPEESVNFDTTENVLIHGDNLESLKLLQKAYLNKVKVIYIDPPYNTGNDFVYPDNYAESLETYLEYTGQVDTEGKKFGTNTEADGRFHSKWLNMLYPRLYLARNLLTDDGVIFISIDDHEIVNLRRICDEVFGEANYKGTIVRATGQTTGQDSGGLGASFDYVVVYSKTADTELSGLPLDDDDLERYQEEDERGKYALWQLRKTGKNDRRTDRPNMYFAVKNPDGGDVWPVGPTGYESRWRFDSKGYKRLLEEGYVVWRKRKKGDTEEWWPYVKTYLEGRTKRPSPLWDDLEGSKKASIDLRDLMGGSVFNNPKPLGLITRLLQVAPSPNSDCIVMDFFAGSGTTGHAVLSLNAEDGGNRRFVLIQLPEPLDPSEKDQKAGADFCDSIAKPRNIAEIMTERIRRAIKSVNEEDAGKLNLDGQESKDRGFREFKLGESNFTAWNAEGAKDPAALATQLELHVEHIRQQRTDDDILYELLLKSGFPLTTPVEKKTVEGKAIYSVASGALVICLDRALTLELIRAIADMKPDRVVCLDEGFVGNDQLKTNAVQTFKTKGITSFKTV